MAELFAARRRTRDDSAKWERFRARYWPTPSSDPHRDQLKAALSSLHRLAQEDCQRQPTELAYGFARLDAFGHIFNKVLAITGAAEQTWNPSLHRSAIRFSGSTHRAGDPAVEVASPKELSAGLGVDVALATSARSPASRRRDAESRRIPAPGRVPGRAPRSTNLDQAGRDAAEPQAAPWPEMFHRSTLRDGRRERPFERSCAQCDAVLCATSSRRDRQSIRCPS